MREAARVCVVVPAYKEQGRIGPVVRRCLEFCPDVVVVDDGSGDGSAGEAREAGAVVLVHEVNRGKGAALDTGFRHARERGYEAVITLDADGQHDPAEIPKFLEVYRREGTPVLIGSRMSDVRAMPFIRLCTNRFMSWLLSRYLGQRVPDTQSGYRLYRCDALEGFVAGAARYAAESEVLLFLADRGCRIGAVPIRTIYGDEKSKIHPVRDTVRFFSMLRRYRRRRRNPGSP
jgi:glycosyltransferase involved in cell wall biosynthesis